MGHFLSQSFMSCFAVYSSIHPFSSNYRVLPLLIKPMSCLKLDLSHGPTRHIVGDDKMSFWLSLCHVPHTQMAVAWGFGLAASSVERYMARW